MLTGVCVEKVPQLMLVVVQASGYKQANAVVHHNIWRPAAHDGTPFPRGVAVLLLPARRSCSLKSSATPDRSPRQFGIYSSQVEGCLQRCGKAVDRPRTAVAHPADRLSVWHQQRAQVGGRATHACGVALVHRTGLRSGDSAPLYVFQEPAWTIPGIEFVSRAV